MGVVGTAAFDPIFWSHHAMIDRLWWLWQARNGNGNISTLARRGPGTIQFQGP
jgi:hypothetical protein